ncbi:MAG TPA: hypothetical protein VGV57_09515, partial [Thermoleophilaceae bacterium]|nr:hypothetical protein [Thermoleophilaceae bacterium]
MPTLLKVPTAVSLTLLLGALAGCGGDSNVLTRSAEPNRTNAARHAASEEEGNVYAATRPGMLTGAARGVPYRLYVPNSESDTVDVIDPKKEEIVSSFSVGGLPQHVTPAPDMRTLYVNSNQGNSLMRIDPRTARP